MWRSRPEPCKPKQWPENLTLSSVLYFVVVPTLCYQIEYPRARRIRRVWLAKRLLELAARDPLKRLRGLSATVPLRGCGISLFNARYFSLCAVLPPLCP